MIVAVAATVVMACLIVAAIGYVTEPDPWPIIRDRLTPIITIGIVAIAALIALETVTALVF